jgi:hypothetical protein
MEYRLKRGILRDGSSFGGEPAIAAERKAKQGNGL